MAIADPFTDESPAEVPLASAPLVRVIAQVRFPLVASIEQREFIGPFQEAIRAEYPILRQEQTTQLLMGFNVVPSTSTANTAWRFVNEDGHWRVSLTGDFLALETTKYTSREDFLQRLETVVAALAVRVKPKLVDRLGVRYIDRVSGDGLAQIDRLVRPEVRGLAGSPAATSMTYSITETQFMKDDTHALVRWGQLPPGATIDPAVIEPAEVPSWILDLDMFSSKPAPFSVAGVIADTRRYMQRIYTLFRWAVTDDFLRQFGGK